MSSVGQQTHSASTHLSSDTLCVLGSRTRLWKESVESQLSPVNLLVDNAGDILEGLGMSIN